MKGKLLLTIGMLLTLSVGAFAQEHEVTVVSEVKQLPNGEIPSIVVKPVNQEDKVKGVEIYPFIKGKAKIVIKMLSSSPLSHRPVGESGVVEIRSY